MTTFNVETSAADWEEFWNEDAHDEEPLLPRVRDWAERVADELVLQSGAVFTELQLRVLVEAVRRGFAFRI